MSNISLLRRLYPSVNARITLPFLLTIIAIAGVGVYIVTNLVAGSVQERFNNQLLDSATAATNTVVDVEREYLALLRQMAFTDGVPEALAAGDSDSLDGWLRPLAANNTADELILFDANGEIVLYLTRLDTIMQVEYGSPTPPQISDWRGVSRVLSGTADTLGDKFVDMIETETGMTFFFTAPVIDADVGLVGGVALGIRAESLALQVSQQSLSSIVLLSETGSIITSTFRVDASRLTMEPEQATEYAQLVEETSPVQQMQLNEIPYQVLYTAFRLRSQPVGVLAVGLPSNYVVERSSTSRNLVGGLFGLMFMLVAILGLFVGRTITSPIRRLVSTTRAIREGDLSQRVRLGSPDELGELGVSFDHMTDRLVNRNQEISALYDQQVQETAQREAVLTSISDAVIVQATDGKMILHNHTAGELMDALMHNRQQRRVFTNLCASPQALATPQIVTFVGRHFSVLATPVRMETGDLLGYVIVFRDITALIQSEELKDELVLQMSHELRTPLGAVRGFVDLVKMLEAASLSDQAQGFMDKATLHLDTLERLINQVVDVSTMIANRFTIEIEEFDFAQVLNETFDRWRNFSAERGHQLSLSLSSQAMWMEADPNYLEEVLDHLLRNAHDYTLSGGLIAIYAQYTPQQVRVRIVDNGVGIDSDEIEHVFERMYRGRSADAGETDARGMGLGLYISQQIIHAHGGEIDIISAVDRGTTVTFTLPTRQPQEMVPRE